MVFQEPMTALNPLLTIGRQIGEVLELHEGLSRAEAHERAAGLLDRVGIDDPQRRALAYPHQLSGGQRQRALIAMALACRPALLIADEPTTALDMTLRQQVLDLLIALQEDTGMGILLITHDLPMVRRFAQSVGVMQSGRLVESGPVEAVFTKPQAPYTKALLDAQPKKMVGAPGPRQVMLEVRRLSCQFAVGGSLFRSRFHTAVNRESFIATRGETLGIVGESGSGKTTLGLSLLRLSAARVSGEVRFDGVDLLALSGAEMRSRRASLQAVFQDPYSALSPRLTVGQILEEGLRLHRPAMTPSERLARCEACLEEVGLPADAIGRYPHEFSGGQRQRIAIARAIIFEPALLLLDEPTSALDLSVQQQILTLLVQLQQAKGLTYIFISHDLSVIRAIAHRTLVMRQGSIVEFGATDDVLGQPRQPYTQQLLDAAFPEERLAGVASPAAPSAGLSRAARLLI
jgi:microcin C transport system ATP-binding protein